MGEVTAAWETPDSPEDFCYAMKGLMNAKTRVALRLVASGFENFSEENP